MTFLDAAARVLADAGKPMHFTAITEMALAKEILVTEGKTPAATMHSLLAVALKKRGEECRFVRTAPATYGLREWVEQGRVTAPREEADDEQQVRIPHFPVYAQVRAALPIVDGIAGNTVTGTRASIVAQRGNPQDNRDWTDPDAWIPEVLTGDQREFATQLWEGSEGTVNPRHFLGHWLLSRRYGLIADAPSGRLQITDRGRAFVDTPTGEVVREIDANEGVFKILSLVAELGPARKSALIEPWQDYLSQVSNVRSDSYASSTLWARLRNLRERNYVEFANAAYSVTTEGLEWLGDAGHGGGETDVDTYQQVLSLAQSQKREIQEAVHELLHEMDPYAFEIMIAQLLDEMGYDDTEVTPRGNDKGVDVLATIEMGITTVKEVIQVKRFRANIQRPVLDALRGSLHRFRADRGTIITTGGFSKGTIDAAIEPGAAPITLIDGDRLVALLIEHGIGVHKRPVDLFELDASAFGSSAPDLDDEAAAEVGE